MQIRASTLTVAALLLSLCMSGAVAGGKSSARQQQGADCTAQPAASKGSQRGASSQGCPKNAPAPAATPQGAGSSCQAEARSRGLKGQPRRAFVESCMANSGGR
ncbi:MAG TPA: PsiF family protein [Dokdonella sp.]|jgi:hypothetical protein|nr:PsiF family protein [Dokdonella sp.]